MGRVSLLEKPSPEHWEAISWPVKSAENTTVPTSSIGGHATWHAITVKAGLKVTSAACEGNRQHSGMRGSPSHLELEMADIFHDFPIKSPVNRVFEAVSTPGGLDQWWTKRSAGQPTLGAEFELWFGPKYDWRAKVAKWVAPSEFELEITKADPDWIGTRVGFQLAGRGNGTQVQFHHTGWPTSNEHWRISCYCWAMYLRVLRRYLEHGEEVPYEDRLDV